jgi:general secretion pathway protein G
VPAREGAGGRGRERGMTFVELMATATIMAILASAILPLARVTHKREREIELRRALREMRTAIDRYKLAVDQGQIGGTDVKLGSEGYPPDLETLVKGVSQVGQIDRKLKFLRRISVDPMTRSTEWGLRCYQDEPDDTSWCGDNVWDVYTTSEGTALDGTKYRDW